MFTENDVITSESQYSCNDVPRIKCGIQQSVHVAYVLNRGSVNRENQWVAFTVTERMELEESRLSKTSETQEDKPCLTCIVLCMCGS